MSYIAKVVAAGTLSAGAIGGASYAGYRHFTKVSFADKLGVSVLNLTGNDNEKEWGLRLTELKKKDSGLDSTLSALKEKTWQEVRDWCNNNSSNKFVEEKDTKYTNFEEFCTWKIGDKLSEKIVATVEDSGDAWGKAHGVLKAVEDKTKLSAKLKEIEAIANAADAHKKAFHDWCTENYKKTWVGDDNQVFTETQKYCKKG